MSDQKRGRPRLADEERNRRRDICRAWVAEIKRRRPELSARDLAKALCYGSSSDDADGRAWRALASGSRTPSPEKFRVMTVIAVENEFLDPFGYMRYMGYWSSSDEGDTPDQRYDDGAQYEEQWRNGTLGRALLILAAHARRCGVDQEQFFLDARATLGHLESFLCSLSDEEIRSRAKRVVSDTAQRLADGPEYPETSLVLRDADVDYCDPEA